MTEEEYFRKTYPDYCYGDRLLSPYWDLFQDGTEFGERQSEKKIEELEKENEQLKSTAEFQQSSNMKRHFEIQELKKENRDLADCNARLLTQAAAATKRVVALEEENAELEEYKNGNFVQTVNQIIEGKDKRLEQATEIIKHCIHILKHSGTALDWKTVINQAEQFLKEIEK